MLTTSSEIKYKTPNHNFHLVKLSPWPIMTAISLFTMLLGLVQYMHSYEYGLIFFFFGIFSSLVVASFWFRDIVREATYEGKHTLIVQRGLRFGMALFIVSEIMLFFAFFWAYFHVAFHPTGHLGGVWPPTEIIAVNPWDIPFLNTLLLLTSGASLTASHTALSWGNYFAANRNLFITTILALIFTSLQVFEYFNAPFDITDGFYGSIFYMLTGLHGFHVLVGFIMLSITRARLTRHQFTRQSHVGFECAAWYWHFVDVVWILLFLIVYVYGSSYEFVSFLSTH